MGDLPEVRIASLGNDVGGVSPGKDRKTLFVRGALPGELVRCRPEKEAGSFIRADLLEVVEPSPHRIEPFCRHFGRCGGCSLQHLEYGRQLHWKRQWVLRALQRTGIAFSEDMVSEPVHSPIVREYRNRVSFDMTAEGPGLHMQRGDPIPVEGCPLLNRRGGQVFSSLAGRALPGCSRVSVRGSDRTGRAMLEFSALPAAGLPDTGDGVAMWWKEEEEWLGPSSNSAFHERLGGLTYRIGPGGFFQVNTGCAELLVEKVAGLAGGAGNILDLYGGCGTFALPAASLGAKVTSVELDPLSSADGGRSADINGVKGVEFIACKAGRYLLDTVRSGRRWDAVIVDPPRAGLGVRTARLLRRVNSPLIIYVSCNPFSLARDLGVICQGHWLFAGLQPVDMFPQTDHVETVTELRRVEQG
jgi:tRNA/tmRNA/rRNA uracil-C5-methylase (TrmA/RlmC/RlmD family)